MGSSDWLRAVNSLGCRLRNARGALRRGANGKAHHTLYRLGVAAMALARRIRLAGTTTTRGRHGAV